VVELLYHGGRSLPHAMIHADPRGLAEPPTMSDEKKAFYQYHACLSEPWDGPASIPFSDGTCVGAVLDRNGLRPSRYRDQGRLRHHGLRNRRAGSPDPANVAQKGRLQPGRMFLVDMSKGRIVDDEEIKHRSGQPRPTAPGSTSTWLPWISCRPPEGAARPVRRT
jgi:glutamate synthase (NADPH/NADH) large chain